MARNGSGTYSRVTGTPYVYNTTIDQVVVNAEMDDIATALTNSLAKDGQTTPTANLPMGGYKLTGLAAGTGNGESVRYEQVGALALAQGAVDITGDAFTGPVLFDTVADIASAATIDLTAYGSGFIATVTGTTPTTTFVMSDGQFGTLVAAGAWPLTNTADTCEVLGGDFTAVADDQFTVTKTGGVVRVFPHSLASRAKTAADLRGEIEIISFTRDLAAASGSVDYPVPSGRTPKWIELKMWIGATPSRSSGTGNGSVRCAEITAGNGNATGSTAWVCNIYAAGSGAANQTAVETLSAGNVALAWTKNSTPTGTTVGQIVCHH